MLAKTISRRPQPRSSNKTKLSVEGSVEILSELQIQPVV
jgi:hypothetical protein